MVKIYARKKLATSRLDGEMVFWDAVYSNLVANS